MDERKELLKMVEEARKELFFAEEAFRFVECDPIKIDEALFRIDSAKAHYVSLWKQAQRDNIKWGEKELYKRLVLK